MGGRGVIEDLEAQEGLSDNFAYKIAWLGLKANTQKLLKRLWESLRFQADQRKREFLDVPKHTAIHTNRLIIFAKFDKTMFC